MDISVKIFLKGGHEYTFPLPSDSPLLKGLFQAVLNQSLKSTSGLNQLFQIPLQVGESRSVISFLSESLISVITEPAMLVQPIEDFVVGDASLFNPSAVSLDHSAEIAARNICPLESEAALNHSDIIEAKFIQIDHFFPLNQKNTLLESVIQRESEFIPTTHGGQAHTEYRNSRVLPLTLNDIAAVGSYIKSKVPEILAQLNLPDFSVGDIEAQITAHNDGHYYKVHQDNGTPDLAPRQLTYVYYFYRDPKPFSGGELLLYDYRMDKGRCVKTDSFKTVVPRNNSIVFFQSFYWHEVLPVVCPSQCFADSRFTLNGWVRHLV